MKKLVIVFPGMGYHADKPLLYYSKKMARSYGYEVLDLKYHGFPKAEKDSEERMLQIFEIAKSQTEEQLADIDFQAYDSLLFLSKSIGTIVAADFAVRHHLESRNVFYTPLRETFLFLKKGMHGIAFHGTKDGWADTDLLTQKCRETDIPLYLVENGNHSLETLEIMTDIRNLEIVMEKTREYIETL